MRNSRGSPGVCCYDVHGAAPNSKRAALSTVRHGTSRFYSEEVFGHYTVWCFNTVGCAQKVVRNAFSTGRKCGQFVTRDRSSSCYCCSDWSDHVASLPSIDREIVRSSSHKGFDRYTHAWLTSEAASSIGLEPLPPHPPPLSKP